MSNSLIEVNGKKYMNTKAAAELWDVRPNTVREYCKEDRVSDKFKTESGQWYISIDEMKPLTKEEVRKFLILTLQLKNNPNREIEWPFLQYDDLVLDRIYNQLYRRGYIKEYLISDPKRIPYEVELTQDGIEMATKYPSKMKIDLVGTLAQWLPIIISVAQLYFQLKPI